MDEQCKRRMSDELALRIRNAIADKEWFTAAANFDTTRYGEWMGDYSDAVKVVDLELKKLWEQADAESK